jgi:hypothetical protein
MIEETKLENAYKLAISARNFHFDHFNKWMTYYYVAVAAIFVGFYNIKDDNYQIKIGLLSLGFLVSILWHLSCKGYYFWVKNWLDIVLKLEHQLQDEQKIYSLFSKRIKDENDSLLIPTQSANISTSKVTLLLSFIVSTTWAFLLIDKLDYCGMHFFIKLILSISANYLLILGLGQLLKSDISKHKLFKIEH